MNPGSNKKNTETSSPLVKFNFPSPPPLPNNPSSELPDLKSAQNSDYDIPRSHRNLKTGKEKYYKIIIEFNKEFMIYCTHNGKNETHYRVSSH